MHVSKQNGERKVFGREEAIGNRSNKDTKRPCGRWFVKADLTQVSK
ncbi:MAG: hypothetical protein HDKAJFGB_03238 [Anaerolineae bacterium]|nr:hypothetical protein [Anaerolineae bacterium]